MGILKELFSTKYNPSKLGLYADALLTKSEKVRNAFCPTGDGGGTDDSCPPKKESASKETEPTESKPTKSEIAKGSARRIDRKEQRYAEEYNEPRLAAILGGQSHPNCEPKDISTDKHLIELKTVVSNSAGKITMDSYAQVRKIMAEKEEKKAFHTVISMDQNIYDKDGPGQHGSDEDREYYYRRGVAGSARISSMYYCGKGKKGEAELKRIMEIPEKDLPDEAKRTDSHLRSGKWKPFEDEIGKGFKNVKTGKVYRAKK